MPKFHPFLQHSFSGKLWGTHMASASSAEGWITNRGRHLCASIFSWSVQTFERRFLYQCGSGVREGSEIINQIKNMHSKSWISCETPKTNRQDTGKFPATGPLQSLATCSYKPSEELVHRSWDRHWSTPEQKSFRKQEVRRLGGLSVIKSCSVIAKTWREKKKKKNVPSKIELDWALILRKMLLPIFSCWIILNAIWSWNYLMTLWKPLGPRKKLHRITVDNWHGNTCCSVSASGRNYSKKRKEKKKRKLQLLWTLQPITVASSCENFPCFMHIFKFHPF